MAISLLPVFTFFTRKYPTIPVITTPVVMTQVCQEVKGLALPPLTGNCLSSIDCIFSQSLSVGGKPASSSNCLMVLCGFFSFIYTVKPVSIITFFILCFASFKYHRELPAE